MLAERMMVLVSENGTLVRKTLLMSKVSFRQVELFM